MSEPTNLPIVTKTEGEAANKISIVTRAAASLDETFYDLGVFTRFAIRFFKEVFMPPFELKEFLKQCYLLGNKSLPLVGLTAFIMGLVFTLQSGPTLSKFGAESWLPAMVAIAMIREIAPVITALICAGKVGSGIGAELASMRVTEQIDAMEVSGNRPFKYVVVTRIMAITLMLPLLAIFSDAIGLLGSFIGVNMLGDTSIRVFLSHIFEKLDFIDIMPAIVKTFFFGFAVGVISCYKGYNANNGTEGVGKAANSSVVVASVAIFVIDMLAVQIANLFI